MERRLQPKRPAARGPAGDTCAATATSGKGRWYGRSCRRALVNVNQSVSIVTVSPASNKRIASRACSIMSRWRAGSMPIMKASDGSAPGPAPIMTRPRVRWSSRTMRSASMNGWWYGREETPVPRRMCLVRWRGGGDEDLGRGDDLVAGRVVLAEPGFVEAELVEMLDQLQIALERERRVLADRVERGQEDPELQSAVGLNGGHRAPRRLGGLCGLGGLLGPLTASFTHEPEGRAFEGSVATTPAAAARRRWPGPRRPAPPTGPR